MLPGGVTEDELNQLWDSIKELTPWHSAILLLENHKLVERRVRQSTGETKILLTKFVGTFAEALIEEQQQTSFHKIIVTQMHKHFSQWYLAINNTNVK